MAILPSKQDLDSFILRFIQDRKREVKVEVPTANQEEYLLLFGLIQRVRRYAKAFVKLRKSGYGPEGVVLLRSALEHAVTAQWCYLTVGGIDRLKVTIVRHEAGFIRSMRNFYSSPDEDWNANESELRNRIPAGKMLPKFTNEGIIADLDHNSFLASTYKVFSQVEHVTHQALHDHVVQDSEGFSLRQAPEFDFQEETNYSLASICLLVAWVQARLETDDKEIAYLIEQGNKLTLPYRLDHNMSAKKRRFSSEINEYK